MTSCDRALALCVLLTAIAGGAQALERGPDFAVCLLANNMPWSERGSGTGFDVDVARAVARAGGRELKPVWVANDPAMTEIDESDLPVARLAREECDAIFSVPGPAEKTLGGRAGLILSAPYYGAAFELLACRADAPAELAALRGQRIAIQAATVAHFALGRVGAEPRTFFSPGAAFTALGAGEADAALLWGPAIGFLLRRARLSGEMLRKPELKSCAFVAGYAPPAALRWNLHVALRARDRRLVEDVERALAAMLAAGELAPIKKSYGIPDHAPFERTYSEAALDELGPRP